MCLSNCEKLYLLLQYSKMLSWTEGQQRPTKKWKQEYKWGETDLQVNLYPTSDPDQTRAADPQHSRAEASSTLSHMVEVFCQLSLNR